MGIFLRDYSSRFEYTVTVCIVLVRDYSSSRFEYTVAVCIVLVRDYSSRFEYTVAVCIVLVRDYSSRFEYTVAVCIVLVRDYSSRFEYTVAVCIVLVTAVQDCQAFIGTCVSEHHTSELERRNFSGIYIVRTSSARVCAPHMDTMRVI